MTAVSVYRKQKESETAKYTASSSSNHKAELGSRRMMPLDLDATLSDVAARRCATRHKTGIPRKFYTRVLNPERNGFLLAPLAEDAVNAFFAPLSLGRPR